MATMFSQEQFRAMDHGDQERTRDLPVAEVAQYMEKFKGVIPKKYLAAMLVATLEMASPKFSDANESGAQLHGVNSPIGGSPSESTMHEAQPKPLGTINTFQQGQTIEAQQPSAPEVSPPAKSGGSMDGIKRAPSATELPSTQPVGEKPQSHHQPMEAGPIDSTTLAGQVHNGDIPRAAGIQTQALSEIMIHGTTGDGVEKSTGHMDHHAEGPSAGDLLEHMEQKRSERGSMQAPESVNAYGWNTAPEQQPAPEQQSAPGPEHGIGSTSFNSEQQQ